MTTNDWIDNEKYSSNRLGALQKRKKTLSRKASQKQKVQPKSNRKRSTKTPRKEAK